MDVPRETSRQLDETVARLDREHLLVIQLDDLRDLLVEPDTEPFAPPRWQRGGAPVRVILPNGASPDVPVAEAQAALRSRAAYLASVAWRDAMAVRNMGRRQLPLGLVFALVSLVIAYAAAAAANDAHSAFAIAAWVVVAAITITVAWVVSWMVIEYRYFDWREAGRKASAYELIARSTLEIT